jgi:hypothetical protein
LTPVFWDVTLRSWVFRNVGGQSPRDAASLPRAPESSTYVGLTVQKRGLVWPREKLLSHIHKTLVSNSGLELSGCEFLFFTGESQDSTDHIFRSECVQSIVCNNYIISFTEYRYTTGLSSLCIQVCMHVFVYVCMCYVCMYACM